MKSTGGVRPKLRGIRQRLGAIRRVPSALARRADRASVRKRRVSLVLLLVLVVAVVSAATVLGFAAERAQSTADARVAATAAARERVADILTYRADTIEADIERARQNTAGAFAETYEKFAQRVIGPGVREAGTSSVPTVKRAAAVSASPDSVVVLVFIDQRTSSKKQPQPRTTPSTARVTMTKIAGQWLISKLTPTSS